MLYSEIIAVCSQIHTQYINTLRGQNLEYLDIRPGGTDSKICALRANKLLNSVIL
jgi:hypothetical protein